MNSDPLPQQLLAAFRAGEQPTDIGVMLAEDGFDVIVVRVLSAWERTEQRWKRPKQPCPDDGRPTAAAWEWLMSGWKIDYATIAVAASVSRDVARDRIEVLKHARLIYPDGQMSTNARNAIRAAVASRLRAAGAGKSQAAAVRKDDGKGN